MKQVEIVVTVKPLRGRGSFPIDMLRYDGLHPASESDSYRITESLSYSPSYTGEPIELRKWDAKSWLPNQARWDSFGWAVINIRSTGRELR